MKGLRKIEEDRIKDFVFDHPTNTLNIKEIKNYIEEKLISKRGDLLSRIFTNTHKEFLQNIILENQVRTHAPV